MGLDTKIYNSSSLLANILSRQRGSLATLHGYCTGKLCIKLDSLVAKCLSQKTDSQRVVVTNCVASSNSLICYGAYAINIATMRDNYLHHQ